MDLKKNKSLSLFKDYVDYPKEFANNLQASLEFSKFPDTEAIQRYQLHFTHNQQEIKWAE